MTPASRIAAALLTVVALAHLFRVLFRVPATVADSVVPMWVSIAATVIAGGVALMLWRDRR